MDEARARAAAAAQELGANALALQAALTAQRVAEKKTAVVAEVSSR